MEKLGIIDIGSNSVRLVLAQINESGSFHIIDEIKETIRLGEDIEINQVLSEDKIIKTIKTLDTFKAICKSLNTSDIIVIATEAVRQSKNGDYFINKVKKDINLDIRVLTGIEEANYDCMAIINSMDTDNSLMIDIGGSSTEIAWIKEGHLKESISLPFGTVNLTKRFNLEDIVRSEDDQAFKGFVIEELNKIPWIFNTKFDNIIGIGGAIRNMGKIDRAIKKYPLDIAHNYKMDSKDINYIYNLVKSKNLKQRLKINGLSADRADIFVAAVSSLNVIINLLHIDEVIVSGKGLREGVLDEYIEVNYNPKEDMLESSIDGILESHYVNKTHAYNVYNLTHKLFDDLKSLHKLNDDFIDILKTGSLLHDCGISVRYYNHHKHSFYIIVNSQLRGLTHRELVLSAYMAAYHRNNYYEINLCHFSSIINRLDLSNIRKIGILLRISEGLDKTMLGSVTNITTIIDDKSVTLKLNASRDIDLEVSEALRCKNKFYEIYEKELIIIQE
ncbi:Ppx/GppA phosphatase family protein [Clostridium algidicarnis]|uniref:Ppx/GppA phosphatase family protein n=1 Tax=Clostridium algidicarnis TaxID=37659 RepID=UPI001C0DB695|nr:Ppx/GppA phosphatase family protein [Clostridium algidicarnis]MBU3192838.1 Ppx/GppA family phosphatase [Clostridium algidicarnis]